MVAVSWFGIPSRIAAAGARWSPEQVLPAHHFGDALQGVVDHDRQMIAGRRLLARQDDVAPGLRMGGDDTGLAVGAFAMLDPAEIAALRDGRAMSSRSA